MASQTQVEHRKADNGRTIAGNLRGELGELAHDVVRLAELQVQLLAADSHTMARRRSALGNRARRSLYHRPRMSPHRCVGDGLHRRVERPRPGLVHALGRPCLYGGERRIGDVKCPSTEDGRRAARALLA